MTDTINRAVVNIANSALLNQNGFVLNTEGLKAIEALKVAFDIAAPYFLDGALTQQMDKDGDGVNVVPATLYAVSLVVKANQEGLRTASVKAYLDFFEMVVMPEKLVDQNQINRNIMLSAAYALKNV